MKTQKQIKTPKIPKAVLDALGKPVKTEVYNTNNAWGFSGIIGTITTFTNPDVVWITGRSCTRHQGTFPVENHIKINGMYFSTADFLKTSNAGAKTSHDFYIYRYPQFA